MAGYSAQSRESGRAPLAITDRADRWWVQPLLIALALGAFGVWGFVRAFEANYISGLEALHHGARVGPHYLSPFYSPPIHEWFGGIRRFAISPALFVLIFPLSFRFTCYYCRRTYYRGIFMDPPACAVAEPRATTNLSYSGETRFPFILMNLHRFALYAIFVIVAFHYVHLYEAFFYQDLADKTHVGVGLGTLILLADTVLLTLYVFSCHSLRHMVGGSLKKFSTARFRHNLWKLVSVLNRRHDLWFWLSLFTVGIADVYIRCIAAGTFADLRLI